MDCAGVAGPAQAVDAVVETAIANAPAKTRSRLDLAQLKVLFTVPLSSDLFGRADRGTAGSRTGRGANPRRSALSRCRRTPWRQRGPRCGRPPGPARLPPPRAPRG